METSQNCLKNVMETLGENWKEILDGYLKNEISDLSDEAQNSIDNFLNACKEEKISDKTSSVQKLEKLIDNDLLYKNLCLYLDQMLSGFYVSAPLRTWTVQDEAAVLTAIEDIFNQSLLRFNPNIPQKYAEFHYPSQEMFIEFLKTLDAINSYCIYKNYCREIIADFVYDQTRLSKKICKKLADLMDKNFSALQMVYLIERIGIKDL